MLISTYLLTLFVRGASFFEGNGRVYSPEEVVVRQGGSWAWILAGKKKDDELYEDERKIKMFTV